MTSQPTAPAPGADAVLAVRLRDRFQQRLYRRRTVVDSPQGTEITIEGRRYLSFCSNDYLDLANDRRVVEAFRRAASMYGVGSGASHLVVGHLRPHHALEEELAAFTARDRALLFSTGYMANLAIATALTDRHDTLFEDRLNHASLLDAALLSRAKLRRYAHGALGDLTRLLACHRSGRKLVLTDGVFSMDGDVAPLSELARSAQVHDAWLAVDDAHGLGVLGPTGRGTLEMHGLNSTDVPILMGTLGKALGVFGAFVAGSTTLVETLIQYARSYIYTTALPPAVAEAARVSLQISRTEPWRRERLFALLHQFREGARQLGLPLSSSVTPIQPLVLTSTSHTLRVAARLRDAGIFVTPIRPPTVPKGQSRLRLTFSSGHQPEHVDRLLDALAESVLL